MMEVMVLRAMMVMTAVVTVMVTMVMWVGGGEGNIDVVAIGRLPVLVILFTITHCIPEPSCQH